MTSRPGPGTQDPLHIRGGGPAYASGRRAANPQPGQLDQPTDGERGPAEERVNKARPKAKPLSLEGLQTITADGVRQAPRGKPEYFFSHTPAGGNEHHARGQIATNLPAPPRPGSSVSGDAAHQRRIFPGGSGVKDDLTVKPQAPDTPSQALMFPGGKTADLFPWTGGHPEDVLSEVLVKNGMSNKCLIMNETNTARPSLWSNLKNKSGISTLSTLFVTILEKRQSSSRFTAPHTFKPPPRLTLRDSTRETWLKDLANPMVRLGRLSRTIPTGVTGKVLLEQCLNKNIPIPRAMWLAKCIGINEIRTHKRKGQSGTNNYYITWVRGWTSAVEQFLESIVTSIGQEEWKPRITYALQLTTHLFKERLLEEDHYLDWVLKSLDASSSERLFFWLLVVSIPDFWSSLTSSRRRGKRLAESLLAHAEKFYALEEAQSTPVLALLENIIAKLVFTKPACFLLPRTWQKHGQTLDLFVQRKAEAGFSSAVTELHERNAQLTQSAGTSTSKVKEPLGHLCHLLDSVDYSANLLFDELALDCMEIISDAEVLVCAVMQWASSIHRQGSHHVYLAARLLRKWSTLGADIYKGIIGYLPTLASDRTKELGLVFRIIAELLRSKTFPLGRYLQWLIATGSLDQHSDLSSMSAWPLRLMTEMPLNGLSVHVQNLRRTLLRGTAYSVEAEEQSIAEMQEAIRYQLPGLFDQGLNGHRQNSVDVSKLSPTVRLEIGIWLREQVVASIEYVDCIPTKDASIEDNGTVCQISLSDFQVVRSYMEQFDDLAVMADIVAIVATSFDSNVLSAAADTLNYHHVAFRAIGAFSPIFERIATRYAAIRTVRFPERELLHSLIDLSHTARADPQLMQLLRFDIGRYDQKNLLTVCSPVSDNMVEGVAPLDVEDEIERILSSGTSMDQQMMSRVFGKIAKYMEERFCQGNQHIDTFSVWLYRLRSFDESTFDVILGAWLRSLLTSDQEQLLSVVIAPLVASGSLKLALFLAAVRDCMQGRQDIQAAKSLQIGVYGLRRILPPKTLAVNSQQQDEYRYRLEQDKFCRQYNSGLLDLVRDLTNLEFSPGEESCEKQLADILCDSRLLDVFRYLAVHQSELVAALVASGPPSSVRVKAILDRLLDPANPLRFSSMTKEQQITSFVQCADPFSLPFCQLELQQIFSVSARSTEDETDQISGALVAAIRTAIDEDQPCWPTLISGLEPQLTCKIREHAEREIINASRFLSGPPSATAHEHVYAGHSLVQKYLSVIDATACSDTQEASSGLLVPLVERLKGVTDLLNSWKDKKSTEGPFVHSDLCYWLHALHRLAVAHGSALVTKASHQHQRVLMWTLRDLITHPGLDQFPTTARCLSDLATLLSDNIADDVRRQLVQRDAAKPVEDDHGAFIFGRAAPPEGWLSLTQPITSAATGNTGSSPQTPNTGPNQYHSQSQQTTGVGSLQRSVSQPVQQQAAQGHGQSRTFSQYSQTSKILPQQLQRMGSNGQGPQGMQLHQMHQMHHAGPQRNMSAAPMQAQRTGISNQAQGSGVKTALVKPEMADLRQIPFTLNRWEVLPECGSNSSANETAISLSLFGARKA